MCVRMHCSTRCPLQPSNHGFADHPTVLAFFCPQTSSPSAPNSPSCLLNLCCLQLLDNKKAEDYALPFSLTVTLRPYQQEGINWLAFLRRFGLHGVLADDMVSGWDLQAVKLCVAVVLYVL